MRNQLFFFFREKTTFGTFDKPHQEFPLDDISRADGQVLNTMETSSEPFSASFLHPLHAPLSQSRALKAIAAGTAETVDVSHS